MERFLLLMFESSLNSTERLLEIGAQTNNIMRNYFKFRQCTFIKFPEKIITCVAINVDSLNIFERRFKCE